MAERRCRLRHPTVCFECVVCGQQYLTSDDPTLSRNHHCSPAALARYEARETRVLNEFDPEHPRIPPHLDERRRPYGQRLEDGFAFMKGFLPW